MLGELIAIDLASFWISAGVFSLSRMRVRWRDVG
jgi:hypothetical protein